MAATRLGKNLLILVIVGVVGGGGYWAAKQKGVFDKKQEPVVDIQPAQTQEDDTPAPPSPQVAQPVVIQQPAEAQAEQPAPVVQQTDPSANRGVQFLLNQGKQQ